MAVSVGSSTLRLDTVWSALLGGQDSVVREVILNLRLPRALNAFSTGGLLAFTPAANANGTGYASFTFQVQDDGGVANSGTDTDLTAKTMTINVV